MADSEQFQAVGGVPRGHHCEAHAQMVGRSEMWRAVGIIGGIVSMIAVVVLARFASVDRVSALEIMLSRAEAENREFRDDIKGEFRQLRIDIKDEFRSIKQERTSAMSNMQPGWKSTP